MGKNDNGMSREEGGRPETRWLEEIIQAGGVAWGRDAANKIRLKRVGAASYL